MTSTHEPLTRISMRLLYLRTALAITFAAPLASMHAQTGVPERLTSVSEARMKAILGEVGITPTLLKPDVFRFTDNSFVVLLYNREGNMQLYAGFQMSVWTLEKINEWNQTHRFNSAYIDEAGDPCVRADLDFAGGTSPAEIREFVSTFRLVLKAFVEFMKR